jgi:hypothetical protein
MPHGVDVQSAIQFLSEADTIVTDAQSQFALFTFELLDIALAGFGETM